MTDTRTSAPPDLPPHAQLIQMSGGAWVAAILYAAARLSLADRLASGPLSATDLAGPTGTQAPILYRFMRTLGSLGVLTEQADGRFGLTALGRALQSDAPGAAHSTILAFGDPSFTRSLEHIVYSLQTGKTGFEKENGLPIFDYFAKHPEMASYFSAAMVGFHGSEPPTVAEAWDFSGARTIVDVGGASGNMLAAILSRYPEPRGVLFDRPHVVGDARTLLASRGVIDRVTIDPGNFFERVTEGGDVYILSHIIHDWNEEQCLTILGNCRRAMKPDGRLLIVETVLPPGDTPHQGKLQDLIMLVIPGGQERTEAEYVTLLDKAGFRLTRVVPTTSVVSIVEAVQA